MFSHSSYTVSLLPPRNRRKGLQCTLVQVTVCTFVQFTVCTLIQVNMCTLVQVIEAVITQERLLYTLIQSAAYSCTDYTVQIPDGIVCGAVSGTWQF